MSKKRNTLTDLDLSVEEEQILEERFRIAIQEKNIAELEKNLERKHPVIKITGKRMIMAAAFWIILVSMSILMYFIMDNGRKGIFNRYYAPVGKQQVAGIYRGMESGLYTPYYLYSEGDFSKALPKFRQYLDANPSDIQANLLLAICLIEEKKFREAESEMEEILQTGNFYLMDDAHWYLALLSVRRGDFTAAVAHLEKIGKKSYALQVQALLKSIEGKKNR